MKTECSGYRPREYTCAHGFVQTFACSAGNANGRQLPWCMRDDLPDHYITEDGLPRFALIAQGDSHGR